MLTKEQKTKQLELAATNIKNSKTILFADFAGVSTKDLETLKNDLRKQGAVVKVFKKRLLKIALKEAGIDYDPTSNDAQLAGIFSPEEISEIAGGVYKYGLALKKANHEVNLEVLSAYDGDSDKVLSQEEFVVIAKLPSKDVLLAQIMGGITGPLRAFMSIVKQLSTQPRPSDDGREEPKAEEPATDSQREVQPPEEVEPPKIAPEEEIKTEETKEEIKTEQVEE